MHFFNALLFLAITFVPSFVVVASPQGANLLRRSDNDYKDRSSISSASLSSVSAKSAPSAASISLQIPSKDILASLPPKDRNPDSDSHSSSDLLSISSGISIDDKFPKSTAPSVTPSKIDYFQKAKNTSPIRGLTTIGKDATKNLRPDLQNKDDKPTKPIPIIAVTESSDDKTAFSTSVATTLANEKSILTDTPKKNDKITSKGTFSPTKKHILSTTKPNSTLVGTRISNASTGSPPSFLVPAKDRSSESPQQRSTLFLSYNYRDKNSSIPIKDKVSEFVSSKAPTATSTKEQAAASSILAKGKNSRLSQDAEPVHSTFKDQDTMPVTRKNNLTSNLPSTLALDHIYAAGPSTLVKSVLISTFLTAFGSTKDYPSFSPKTSNSPVLVNDTGKFAGITSSITSSPTLLKGSNTSLAYLQYAYNSLSDDEKLSNGIRVNLSTSFLISRPGSISSSSKPFVVPFSSSLQVGSSHEQQQASGKVLPIPSAVTSDHGSRSHIAFGPLPIPSKPEVLKLTRTNSQPGGFIPTPNSETKTLTYAGKRLDSAGKAPFLNRTSTLIPVWSPSLLGNAYGGGFIKTPSVFVTLYLDSATSTVASFSENELVSKSTARRSKNYSSEHGSIELKENLSTLFAKNIPAIQTNVEVGNIHDSISSASFPQISIKGNIETATPTPTKALKASPQVLKSRSEQSATITSGVSLATSSTFSSLSLPILENYGSFSLFSEGSSRDKAVDNISLRATSLMNRTPQLPSSQLPYFHTEQDMSSSAILTVSQSKQPNPLSHARFPAKNAVTQSSEDFVISSPSQIERTKSASLKKLPKEDNKSQLPSSSSVLSLSSLTERSNSPKPPFITQPPRTFIPQSTPSNIEQASSLYFDILAEALLTQPLSVNAQSLKASQTGQDVPGSFRTLDVISSQSIPGFSSDSSQTPATFGIPIASLISVFNGFDLSEIERQASTFLAARTKSSANILTTSPQDISGLSRRQTAVTFGIPIASLISVFNDFDLSEIERQVSTFLAARTKSSANILTTSSQGLDSIQSPHSSSLSPSSSPNGQSKSASQVNTRSRLSQSLSPIFDNLPRQFTVTEDNSTKPGPLALGSSKAASPDLAETSQSATTNTANATETSVTKSVITPDNSGLTTSNNLSKNVAGETVKTDSTNGPSASAFADSHATILFTPKNGSFEINSKPESSLLYRGFAHRHRVGAALGIITVSSIFPVIEILISIFC